MTCSFPQRHFVRGIVINIKSNTSKRLCLRGIGWRKKKVSRNGKKNEEFLDGEGFDGEETLLDHSI